MEFRVLGSFEVVDGPRLVRLPGDKPRALLALLLLSANRVLAVERLCDDLWTGRAPPSAMATLQGYIASLAPRALEPGVTAGEQRLLKTMPAGLHHRDRTRQPR